MLNELYKTKLALLTDLYQLTMAFGYWRNGRTEEEAVFNLFFRKNPFGGGYAVAAGLEYAIELLKDFVFDAGDIAYLASLNGNNDEPLFEQEFLEYLQNMKFSCDIDAVQEGTVIFPHQPLIRVKGPLIQCQLLETALLNIVNFQTLIATKAARIAYAAQGEPVLEFGLRRAQGIDGALTASRAAYIGGCAATSNVLAGKLFGIPVKGTHAHSWVMSYEDELESFNAYADAMPNNCVFLVDTYDTIEGVKNAVRVGEKLRDQGHNMVGIRLDSGDLAELSIEARKHLDQAGFRNAAIVASNDLDEFSIEQLKQNGAKISVWGVGTKLAAAYDQPALGGVYKLSAIRKPGEEWQYRIKLSEDAIKVSNPGIQQVRRFYKDGTMVADMIYDAQMQQHDEVSIVNYDGTKIITMDSKEYRDLLVPVFRNGSCVYDTPALSEVREKTLQSLAELPKTVKYLKPEEAYNAGIDQQLMKTKQEMMRKAKGKVVKAA